jgi:hypothetical protein
VAGKAVIAVTGKAVIAAKKKAAADAFIDHDSLV